MNKLNKKGFTLIEMLVVIAIIAVLVSIVVPVVGNSTTKAAAAANAANLRTVAAEVAIKHMESPGTVVIGEKEAADGKLTWGTGDAAITIDAPNAKSVSVGGNDGVSVTKETKMKVKITESGVEATYNGVTIAKFADIADNGKLDSSN